MRKESSFTFLSLLLFLFAAAVIVGIVFAVIWIIKKEKAIPQANEAAENGSYFDGGTFAYLGWSILAWLLSVCSLGIALPWAECMLLRWETKHTVIDGRRLAFDGMGGQLFWRYILWWFLSLITFGIYTFWATVNVLKWETEHTYAEGTNDRNSYFDGKGSGYLGYKILFTLMTVFSLGIAYPWAVKMMLVWTKEHTVISSKRFTYTGTGAQLLGHYLLWVLLSIVTFGIYGLFVPVRVQKLIVGNTHSDVPVGGYASNGYAPIGYVQSSYSETIKNDATRYTLAETNRQLRMMQLGLAEDTPFDKLYSMIQQNIPEAQYILAMQLKIKDENGKAEQIKDLLKKSADAGFAPAQYEYSDSLVSDPAKVTDELVEESAGYFMKSAEDGFLPAEEQWMHFCLETGVDETSEERNADDTLQLGVYWHDIVAERGGEISEEDTILYNAAVEILRMKGIFCGRSPSAGNAPVYTAPSASGYTPVSTKNSNTGKTIAIVIAAIIGGYMVLRLLLAIALPIIIAAKERNTDSGNYASSSTIDDASTTSSNEQNNEPAAPEYDNNYALEFVQGKWYCKVGGDKFMVIKFENTAIKNGDYYTETIPEDNQSANNIYYNGEIYGIIGGGSRSGNFIITQTGDLEYRLDITFPEDIQFGEESYSTFIIRIDPVDTEHFTLVEYDNESLNVNCIRGDIEALRMYS